LEKGGPYLRVGDSNMLGFYNDAAGKSLNEEMDSDWDLVSHFFCALEFFTWNLMRIQAETLKKEIIFPTPGCCSLQY